MTLKVLQFSVCALGHIVCDQRMYIGVSERTGRKGEWKEEEGKKKKREFHFLRDHAMLMLIFKGPGE